MPATAKTNRRRTNKRPTIPCTVCKGREDRRGLVARHSSDAPERGPWPPFRDWGCSRSGGISAAWPADSPPPAHQVHGLADLPLMLSGARDRGGSGYPQNYAGINRWITSAPAATAASLPLPSLLSRRRGASAPGFGRRAAIALRAAHGFDRRRRPLSAGQTRAVPEGTRLGGAPRRRQRPKLREHGGLPP